MTDANNATIIQDTNPTNISTDISNKDNIALCQEKIAGLLEKYEDNDYIKNKLTNHILNQLSGLLDQANVNYIKREERKQRLETDQIEFTNRFLNKHNYFYVSNTDIFFNYDGQHYKTYKEDDILHEILTTITQEENLMPWKHKIKLNMIKQIRENWLFTNIPESYTIQNILNKIFPEIFSSKTAAKYFLTIIGDNILRKNDNLIYLIDAGAKSLIKCIASSAYNYFGNSSILNSFKYRYHEQHNYSDCRLINFDKACRVNTLLNDLTNSSLDLLCVAVYYSRRYNSADEFLAKSEHKELIDYSLYLKNNSLDSIIEEFIDKSLQKSIAYSIPTQFTRINSKKMMYLWKLFLRDNKLPHIIFLSTLKAILRNKIAYDEPSDNFLNITSPHLPLISNFITFWDQNMQENEEDIELEIEEIICLFRHWYSVTQLKLPIALQESFVLELIRHFYSDVIIDEDKYILHITCNIWNKKERIQQFLEDYKEQCLNKGEKYSISLNSLYTNYCKVSKKEICTASKNYFEKSCKELFGDFINDENMISSSWWENVVL